MSMLLVVAEEHQRALISPAPTRYYGFAIDIATLVPIKQKIIKKQVFQALEHLDLENPHLDLVRQLKEKETPYDNGCLHVIHYRSPTMENDQRSQYKQKILSALERFQPVFVDFDTLSAIDQATYTIHELGGVIAEVSDKIFKAQREHALIGENVETSKEAKEAPPQKKM